MRAQGVLQRMWNGAKAWHALRVGPITLYYRLARSMKVGSSARRLNLRPSVIRDPRLERVARGITRHSVAARQTRAASSAPVALIVGIGAHIGPALARILARDGMQVVIVSRDDHKLRRVAQHARAQEGNVHAFQCDVTNESAVRGLLRTVCVDIGTPDLVVYGVQGWTPGSVLDTELSAFEEAWRSTCLGAFAIGRESARAMVSLGRGTIVFLGATSGTVGRSGHLTLAVGKFGLRALAQVMARELGPQGVHVAHVVIDADVSAEEAANDDGLPRTAPDELAELVRWLHQQPRNCWTHELDLRPWNEAFWEHC